MSVSFLQTNYISFQNKIAYGHLYQNVGWGHALFIAISERKVTPWTTLEEETKYHASLDAAPSLAVCLNMLKHGN
jgi:hypothetical protein